MHLKIFFISLLVCYFVKVDFEQIELILINITYTANMGLEATKPVFRVSEKVRLKPVSSATQTS